MFDSFREEFLPWLCKIQYQRTKREKYGRGCLSRLIFRRYINYFLLVLRSITTKEGQVLALRHSTLFGGSIHAGNLSSRGSNSPSLKPIPFSVTSSPAHPDDDDEPLMSLRIGIITHDTVFAGRVNNIATLLEANRQVRFATKFLIHI